MTKIEKFLLKHNQASTQIDSAELMKKFSDEMDKGLATKSSLKMIPTYLTPSTNVVPNKRNLLIDAGGTNFRSAIGYFNDENQAVIEDVTNTAMPGSIAPISVDNFYDAIAENVKHLLLDSNDVGFCFSYSVDMQADMDGVANPLSKEVTVDGIEGTLVGSRTLQSIAKLESSKRGIVILNDTVATLLGGYALNYGRKFDSYIGFIYGTGMNMCYIEQTSAITKIKGSANTQMIINTESGGFDGATLGDYDKIAISNSNDNTQLFEKITSGKYLAEVMYQCLLGAVSEKLFEGETAVKPFALKDVSLFLLGENNNVYMMFDNDDDRSMAKELFINLIDRSAKLCASMNSAVVMRVTKHTNPVAIVAEGTTFNKLTGFKATFKQYMDEILGKNNVEYEIVQGENLNLVGTLMATTVLSEEN